MTSQDALWYKDAVFYELHVKAFHDANADGVGDFRGLVDRLDYIQDLGIDCIWLLPFYPSPLRDDGYDIADYWGVHPSYGTLDDFQRFLDDAHRRGIRVIADLVLNHTSDQHSWFQRARRAPRGSPERNYYVWSDSDDAYPDARIIFTDTEPSNWTWDPVAGQYYWHRFFHHQPDLNWDNPEVKEGMFGVMEYWLDRGLDGFRADAVPYLIERTGTICENLEETHAILKEFRSRLNVKYPGRILLAEANQWPDNVRPYFGDSDEFHMAFHFPLMPRIFMAVRQGIRKPIVEIIERTPRIPPDCQWCMFLRNHDELTLEMVTDEERDYMYQEYAADPRMRLNLGIRRRLAPLMDNDRRKIELLNSILLTMPGSPIIYYGDEIGMGDNIYLGDRDGVRTPMHWSPDRNAGFSRAEPARLYLPAIVDSVYGFQAINVEAQQKSPYSLLNWMKRLIQVRKAHHAFGRGTIEFLTPHNPHVLAYLREYDGDAILVVNNLSGAAQAVQLDLSRFTGHTPVEVLGQTEFLAIDESPYALTLSPYGFFWFDLQPIRAEKVVRPAPMEWAEEDLALLEAPESISSMIAVIPPDWLLQQRWFRSKSREIGTVELVDRAVVGSERGLRILLLAIRVSYEVGSPEAYLLALSPRPSVDGDQDREEEESQSLIVFAGERGELRLHEALTDSDAAFALLDMILAESMVPTSAGQLQGRRAAAAAELATELGDDVLPIRQIAGEQTNSSVVFADRVILKIFRRLEPGTNPDLELSRFLMDQTAFRAFPALTGWIEYRGLDGVDAAVAGLFEYVPNSGDAWAYTLKSLRRFFAAASRSAADPASAAGRQALKRMTGTYFTAVEGLGRVTGEFHAALATAAAADPAFAAEPIGPTDVHEWVAGYQRDVTGVLDDLRRRLDAIPGAFPPHAINELASMAREAPEILQRTSDLQLLEDAGLLKIRFHGDYHLGQVLRALDATDSSEWYILDFEGEPARPLSERRAKSCVLRDVAGMLRSFDYAVRTVLAEQPSHDPSIRHTLNAWAEAWESDVRHRFLDAYRNVVAGLTLVPDDPRVMKRILRVFELEKAVYELRYEMNTRPSWIWLPVQGIRSILRASV